MTVYNRIGQDYGRTRACDHRILEQLIYHLDLDHGQIIADIGAGTGNYANGLASAGYQVLAVEPSQVMRAQHVHQPNVQWLQGVAEAIPIDSETVKGAICVLSTHHFISLDQSFREIKRILAPGGTLVIYTSDPRRRSPDCWLWYYFAEFIRREYDARPPTDQMKTILKSVFSSVAKVSSYSIPSDMSDRFFYSSWQYPDRYLDDGFRAGISIFSKHKGDLLTTCLNRLKRDLESGKWDERFGPVRSRNDYDGGYYFISVSK